VSVLSNPRHERFAQELAKGKTADEAYVLAGYAENRGNAIRLKANERVAGRVAEITGRAADKAEVTAARALSDTEINELRAALKAKLGKEPRLHSKVDPTLLGGLVVKVGSRMIDSSIRTKLAGIRAAMRGN